MEEELDFARYFRILRRYWLLLLAGALVGASAGLLGASLRPLLYEGVTTILIGRSNSVIATATSRALIENHTLAAQTLTEIGGDVSPQRFVSDHLVVEQIPGTNVMRVKVTWRDAGKAAQASRVLSQKAVELNRQVATEEGTAVRAQLKVLLDQAVERLKGAQDEYLRYEDQAQVELLKKDTERMIAERGDLLKLRIDIETEKARLAAAEEEIKKQDRVYSVPRAVNSEAALQRAAERGRAAERNEEVLGYTNDETTAFHRTADKPLPVMPAPPINNRDNKSSSADDSTRELENRAWNKELETRFAAQASAIAATHDSLSRMATASEEADPQMLDLSQPFINPVYQTLAFQIATSRTRLAALERQQREMTVVGKLGSKKFNELSDLYRRTSELARLQTNVELAKQIYGDLTLRYEQSRAESVGSMVQLQIVDEAVTPERPVSRKRAQTAGLGGMAGLVMATLAAIALGMRADRAEA